MRVPVVDTHGRALMPDNQPLVAGVDPGSRFEGFSVVGTKETVLNLMVEAPDHVKDAVKVRRTLRRSKTLDKPLNVG
jgi:hypothetical protein